MSNLTFRFKKNERGWNQRSFIFMRNTLLRATNYLHDPVVVNAHNMPVTGPCFIFGNHSNNLDPFVLNIPMPEEPTAGVMTRDQFHKFLPALFMDSIGIVPTSKYVPDPTVIRNVIRMIDQRRMIVIFPEGGRRWDGRPKEAIESTMKLFWKMKIPVHPVQFVGSYVGWPRWASYPRRNRFKLVFLDPLRPGDFADYDTFRDACVAAMAFHEEDPPAETTPFGVFKPADGIGKLLYRCPLTGEQDAIWTPDGTRVLSRATPRFTYTMNALSQLVGPQGEVVRLSSLYDTIREFPMRTDANGLLLDDARVSVARIDEAHRLGPRVKGRAWLHPEHLGFQIGSETRRFPVDEILYVSIEQNSRITFSLPGETWQLALSQTRALQWQDCVQRLKQHEATEPLRTPVSGRFTQIAV